MELGIVEIGVPQFLKLPGGYGNRPVTDVGIFFIVCGRIADPYLEALAIASFDFGII